MRQFGVLDRINLLTSQHIYYSCAVDASPLFYWQTWGPIDSLIKLEILEPVNKQAHIDQIDQISFAMACHESSISVQNVGRRYNYSVHLPEDKTGYPLVLHYHRNISPTGTLKVMGEQDSEFRISDR